MPSTKFKRNAGQIYLSLVPFIATFFAFVTGHISYKIYLPIWIINACLMATTAWILGGYAIRGHDTEKKHLAAAALFLFTPWIFITIFAGMGAPPDTAKEWVETATEQQVRFSILIFSGILLAFGLAILRAKLSSAGEIFFSTLGFIAIIIAIPLYLFNIAFWHSFTLETFKIKIASTSGLTPEWYFPFYKLDKVIMIVEVVLTYFATAAFAVSIKSVGWFRKTPSNIYIILSVLAISVILLSPFYPASVIAADFPYTPFMIPAFSFLLLYFISINLLLRSGD